MKISELLASGECTLSMEVFPPKTSAKFESVEKSVKEIAELNPAWISVTYGAGGGTSDYTVQISKTIKDMGVTPLAHLSCISSDKETVKKQLDQLSAMGIKNILALRGDKLEDSDMSELTYHYASDLIKEIHEYGDFCVGAACYPEGHPEASDWKTDMANLKKKVDAGVDFLTTQMFFDNSMFYSFLYRAREAGINVPIIAGIMPITTEKQVARAMKLSGSVMPARFRALVDHFGSNPEAMKKAGIIYATDQIIDLLANGVKNIHVYTMNKPDVAEAIMENLKGLM